MTDMMIEGGGSKNIEFKSKDSTEIRSSAAEIKSPALEKPYRKLSEIDAKLNDLFFEDDTNEMPDGNGEAKKDDIDKPDVRETAETSSDETSEPLSKSISELMNRLFGDDFKESAETVGNEKISVDEGADSETGKSKEAETGPEKQDTGKKERNDSKEADVEKKNIALEQVEKTLSTSEGIKELIERHPEKAELWKGQLEALETLNDPDASPVEIRSAQAKLSILKGQILETAVKDALADAGLDVESQQRIVEGESGGTRPDVIAKNNTDYPIKVFDAVIQPGETLSVECKCGGSEYMTSQLINYIPNQLSGQEGTKMLLTTSDINDTPPGLAKDVCDQYGAKLVVVDVRVADVENALKEVARS